MSKEAVIQMTTFIVAVMTLIVALFALILVRQAAHPEVRYVEKAVIVTPSPEPSATPSGVMRANVVSPKVLPLAK